MAEPQTNLRFLKRSNRKPESGDIFAMQPQDDRYIFGRVIGADLKPPKAPMPLAYLIYVYDYSCSSKEPLLDRLLPGRLLLPPVFINRMPWTRGYFENVRHEDLRTDDLVVQHCFWDAARARYVDEQQRPLSTESQPCGDWGLSSYRWLDDQVSDAIGIPRVPKD